MPDMSSRDTQLLVLVLGGGAFAVGLLLLLNRTKVPPGGKSSPCPPLGDVDDSGFITMNDAQMIADALVHKITLTPAQLLRADVQRTGVLSIVDAQLIAMYLAGIINTFPGCSRPIISPVLLPPV